MNNPIIFFDGYCFLCNRFVRILISIDKRRQLRFATLDSLTSKSLFSNEQIVGFPDSVILFYNNRTFVKSNAVIKIFEIVGGYWKVISFIKILPARLLDRIYDLIAGSRYKIFGKSDTCLILSGKFHEYILP